MINIFRKTDKYIRHDYPAHEAGKPILKVSNLSAHYNGDMALEDVSFELQKADRVAVVGPNGAGKSTLFKVVAGILPPSDGMVEIAGYEPGGHICIAYLPQRSQVDWSFPATVADVVMMGRISKMGLFRWPTARDWNLVRQCLEIVGLDELQDRQIEELSGGQQQRMFIARALAQEAELMLMDEPLTGLDIQSQEDIFHILESLRSRGVTVLVAMHDLDLAASHFDQVMLINRRLLGFGAADQVFVPELLLKAYGGRLRIVDVQEGEMILSDSCCDEGATIDEHLH